MNENEMENRTHEWMVSALKSLKCDDSIILYVAQKIERIPLHNQDRARDYVVRLVRLGMNKVDAANDALEVYGNVQSQ